MAETYSAGIVTAYGAAVRGGYTGTYEEFCAEQASFAENAEQVAQDRAAMETLVAQFSGSTVPAAVQTVQNAGAAQIQAVESASETEQQQIREAGTAQEARVIQAGDEQVDAVEEAGATQVQAVEDKGQEVIGSIPADYTELTEDVDNLKTAFDEMQYKTGNLFFADEFAVDGLTITKNGDGTLTINGTTATATNGYIMGDSAGHPIQNVEPGTYTAQIELLSGSVSAKAALILSYSNSITRWVRVLDDPATVTFGDETAGNARRVFLRFSSGQTFVNARVRISINVGTHITDTSPFKVTPDYTARESLENFPIPEPDLIWRNYINTKLDTIRGRVETIGASSMHFLFFTDYHLEENDRNLEPIINYLMSRTDAQYIIFGGDAISHPAAETRAAGIERLMQFRSDFQHLWRKIYPVIGNHDWSTYNNASTYDTPPDHMLTMSQLTNVLMEKDGIGLPNLSPDGNYYVDDRVKKVRTVFIGCDVGAHLTVADQIWFFQTLSEIPCGYSVLVVSHRFVGYGGKDQYVTNAEHPFFPYLSPSIHGTSAIAKGLAYLKAAQSVSFRGTEYDFSGFSGDVIGVISGHVHYDLCLYFTWDTQNDVPVWSKTRVNSSYIPAISVTCDSYMPIYIPGQDREPVESEEAYNSATKVNRQTLDTWDVRRHAFDDVLIDLTNKSIYLTRIGAGDNKTMAF